MKHEEIYNTVRMICGSLLMVGMFMIPSCEDNRVEEEVSLEPSMQLWVNGDYIQPNTYYDQIFSSLKNFSMPIHRKRLAYKGSIIWIILTFIIVAYRCYSLRLIFFI